MADFLVKIGTGLNQIKGGSTLDGYVDQLECTSLRHAVELPVMAKSGVRITGVSRHGTVELTHRIDKASPTLRQALCQNRNLDTVVITRLATGKVEETITLLNAVCAQIQIDTPVDRATGEPFDEPVETFCLDYSGIVWNHNVGNITGSWNQSRLTTSVTVPP